MNEIWKNVLGYEGAYEVSNQGRVRRIGRGLGVQPGRILQTRKTKDGYAKVKLCIRGKGKLVSVHTLVAEGFLGKRPPGQQVNHKNGIEDDNRVENLEWVTPSQNLQHAFDHLGRVSPHGESHGVSRLTEEQVREIRRLHALHKGGKSHEYSYSDLAERFGVTRGNIGHIVRRVAWKHI
jgi:hypothetical protein